jgi:putative spermidine/putrescine transport system substrate-binding protein
MDRRSFMVGSSSSSLALLATGLGGCQAKGAEALKVRILKGSIPAALPNAFLRQVQAAQVDVVPAEQLADLFNLLQRFAQPPESLPKPHPLGQFLGNLQVWRPAQERNRTPVAPDLVTLGDAWLAVAIRQGLIQPLSPSARFESLEGCFKQLVKRNDQGLSDPNGQIWAAPYRWGATVIAYRKDLLAARNIAPPQDWADLWRSEFRGRLSLPDQPREVIGLVLKRLGLSYNAQDLNHPDLQTQLKQLHQQVNFYSNDNYLQPLILGDSWVVVGSSVDLLRQARNIENIQLVFPPSGTALWADLWVRPKGAIAQKSVLTNQWIDFCWSDAVVLQLSLMTQAASPMLHQVKAMALSQDLFENSLLRPSEEAWGKSEFLQPLPDKAMQAFISLWEGLRPPVSR